jgi:hypothetical protein
MKESRRSFVKTSIAFGTLIVTKAIAQPGRPAVVSRKQIGVLVSTKDRLKHDNAFQQALSTKGWDRSKVQFDYKHADDDYNVSTNQTLKNLAGQHIANRADLIVAAGGLPTATAVASAVTASIAGGNNATPPFIFLIGRYPTSNAGTDVEAADLYSCSRTYKVGGVDQAVPAQNQGNFELLRIKSTGVVTIDTVGLIVNNNNPITPPEIDAWRGLRDTTDPGKRINSNFIYPIKDPNNQNHGISNLLTSIRNANPQPTGIVVSSDAYLREVGDVDFDAQLRDATSSNKGGHFNGWVCYPYKEYVLASAKSIYSATTPVLATDPDDPTYTMAAYYQLGITAATILDQLVSGTSPANAGLTTWNGSQWNPPDLTFL